MPEFNCDFHIHSKYSGGSSKDMELPLIARQAELKGLDAVGTGDALHPGWLKHVKENLGEESDGCYGIGGSKTKFFITTEVEDNARVHHVILLPSIDAAQQLGETLGKHSVDVDKDGRPHLKINGEQLIDEAKKANALIGPSHAFTPWTAVYKEYKSLKDCYGTNLKDVKFLELGLSADTSMADRIQELQDIVFMSNSDCHSPWPHRLGREFNRLMLKELSFPELERALDRNGKREFTLNAGLNPREGKYHLTACSRCYLKFKLEDAVGLKNRCPECRGIIKKGVADRINEIATWSEPKHPPHRPRYAHIIPLAEAIALAYNVNTLTSKTVKDKWDAMVRKFGTEINVLVDANISEVKIMDAKVGSVIESFREGRMQYVAGGGGQYGRPTLTGEKDNYWGYGQKTLTDW